MKETGVIHGSWMKYKLEQPEVEEWNRKEGPRSFLFSGMSWKQPWTTWSWQFDGYFYIPGHWTSAFHSNIDIGTLLQVREDYVFLFSSMYVLNIFLTINLCEGIRRDRTLEKRFNLKLIVGWSSICLYKSKLVNM